MTAEKEEPAIVIAEHIKKLQAYIPGKTLEDVKEMYNPERIAKLASNENRIGCSPKALEAAAKSFSTINNYPDALSTELRDKLADIIGVERDNIVCGGGSEAIIYQIMRTFLKEGDEAITVDATFVGFFVAAQIKNVTVKRVPFDSNYSYNLNKIADAITDNIRCIYLANPNNPTGTYFRSDAFEEFMSKVPKNVLVVIDEAYYDYAIHQADGYPDTTVYRYPNVITLRTFSKSYGLAGFRVGYAVGVKELIAPMLKTKLTFDPAAPGQAAALAALDDVEFLQRTIESVNNGRQHLYDIFRKHNLKYIPSFANSVMVQFENEQNAALFTDELLKQGVVVRHLPAFGLPDCVRVSTGLPEDHEQLEAALNNMYSNEK